MLSRIYLDGALTTEFKVWAIMLTPILIALVRAVRNYLYKKKIKYNDLVANNITRDEIREIINAQGEVVKKIVKRVAEVKITDEHIIFKKYNRKLTPESFHKNIELFNHIYDVKIIDIESRKHKILGVLKAEQPWIILKLSRYKGKNTPDKYRAIPKYSFVIGDDGVTEGSLQDIKDEGQNTICSYGQKGSGKTYATISMISSFYGINGYRKNETPEHEVIFFDYKLNDFLEIAQQLDGYMFDTGSPEELRNGRKYLQRRMDEHKEYKKYLNDNGIIVSNWLNHNCPLKPRPFVLVIDEAKQTFKKINLKKPSKDASEEEIKRYEYNLEKQKLGYLVDEIAEVYRAYGCAIFLSTQDPRSTTYAIDLETNFKTKLVSQLNSQMSQMLTGSNIATDKTLRKGTFIYISNDVKKIKIPRIEEPPTTKGIIRKTITDE